MQITALEMFAIGDQKENLNWLNYSLLFSHYYHIIETGHLAKQQTGEYTKQALTIVGMGFQESSAIYDHRKQREGIIPIASLRANHAADIFFWIPALSKRWKHNLSHQKDNRDART